MILEPKILKFARMRKIVILFVLSVLLWSCETDFEVNAPWKEATIVYGLLEANQDTQYVKIYKAFLGQEDALVMASNPDSIYYNPSEVSTYLLGIYNNEVVDTIFLRDTIFTPLEEGLFVEDPNQVFYTSEKIKGHYTYQLVFISKRNEVRASCRVVEDSYITDPAYKDLSFVSSFWNSGDDSLRYQTQFLIWNDFLENSSVYELRFRFIYDEYENGSNGAFLQRDSIEWQLLFSEANDIKDNYNFAGQDFFAGLGSRIQADEGIKRKPILIKLVYTAAGQELYDYYEYSKPSLSVLLDKPDFEGNVNGGYGVFSSRIRQTVLRGVSPKTRQALIESPLTEDLNFFN